jgi:hypothetical protein
MQEDQVVLISGTLEISSLVLAPHCLERAADARSVTTIPVGRIPFRREICSFSEVSQSGVAVGVQGLT